MMDTTTIRILTSVYKPAVELRDEIAKRLGLRFMTASAAVGYLIDLGVSTFKGGKSK